MSAPFVIREAVASDYERALALFVEVDALHVGRALTCAAEAWALARGGQWLELVVYDFNSAARAFYDALGYLPASTKLRKALRQ